MVKSKFFDPGAASDEYNRSVQAAGLGSSDRARRAAVELAESMGVSLSGEFALALADHVRSRGATEVSAEDIKTMSAVFGGQVSAEQAAKHPRAPQPVKKLKVKGQTL